MTTTVGARPGRNAVTALRWATCFGVVLGLHVGLILILLHHVLPPAEQSAAAPAAEAIMLDLAPEAVTPSSEPMPSSEARPPPEPPPILTPDPAPKPEPPPDPTPEPQPQASVPAPPEPTPSVPAPELAPEPQTQHSALTLPEPIPPPPPVAKPAVAPPERSATPVRPTPSRAVSRPQAVRQPKPDQTTALSPPEPVRVPPTSTLATPAVLSSNAVPSWRGELIGKLQQAKRYPEAARARNEQGIATAKLTMDRSGHVLSATLVHSSGSETLDEEAVAMIRRADPLPPPPAELAGNTLTLTIPVTFSLR